MLKCSFLIATDLLPAEQCLEPAVLGDAVRFIEERAARGQPFGTGPMGAIPA